MKEPNRTPGRMWWNRDALRLLLIVVAVFRGTVNGATELDMAPNSVDDRYKGCRTEVLEKVLQSGLLEKELDASPEFKATWGVSVDCPLEVPGGLEQHKRALLAYAYARDSFRNKFNSAVKTMAQNNSFPFWSLHFLLTDSMALLTKEECKTVYLVSSQNYVVHKGATVRLGGFMAAEVDASDLTEHPDLDGGVLFNITSCFVLDMEKIGVCRQDNVHMLLGPSEVYTVEDVQPVIQENYKVITLKHYNLTSTDCHLSPRSDSQRGSSTNVLSCRWVVYLMVAILGLLK